MLHSTLVLYHTIPYHTIPTTYFYPLLIADMEKDANGANAVCGKFSESGEILGGNHSTYSKF